MIMEKPNRLLYNSEGHYESDLEKYNEMKREEILNHAIHFFNSNHLQLSGVNGGEYLDREDFLKFIDSIATQFKAEPSQSKPSYFARKHREQGWATQPSQCAGVWVYPPELPKTAGTYIVEFTTKYVERCAFYGDKKQFFVGSDNVTEYVKRWLDESQPQCAVSDEEIEKMAEYEYPYRTTRINEGMEFRSLKLQKEAYTKGFKAALRKQVWDK